MEMTLIVSVRMALILILNKTGPSVFLMCCADSYCLPLNWLPTSPGLLQSLQIGSTLMTGAGVSAGLGNVSSLPALSHSL